MIKSVPRKVLHADEAWLYTLTSLQRDGANVNPRGMPCLELVGYTHTIDMNFPVVMNETRTLNYRFMVGEAWWILTGRDDLESIRPYNSKIADYSDDGISFYGAYGPRFRDQVDQVVDTIGRDLHTRQAVLTLWRQNPQPTKDVPCTVALQFMVRDGVVHTNVFMRSSDVWLGFPYDVFNFTMMTAYVKHRLARVYGINVGLGYMTLVAGSQHLYTSNLDRANAVIMAWNPTPGGLGPRLQEPEIRSEFELMGALQEIAKLPTNLAIKEALTGHGRVSPIT